jgi:hypothetical protein
MKNPEALTFRIPKGKLRPVAGKLYLFYMHLFKDLFCPVIFASLQFLFSLSKPTTGLSGT